MHQAPEPITVLTSHGHRGTSSPPEPQKSFVHNPEKRSPRAPAVLLVSTSPSICRKPQCMVSFQSHRLWPRQVCVTKYLGLKCCLSRTTLFPGDGGGHQQWSIVLRTCSLDKMGREVVPIVKSKVLGCSREIQLCLSGKLSPSPDPEFIL